ncbi:MAG: hypothetical protein NTZ55_03060 [Candidatus Roizmanbacteria bacterium]|nr:hypothetical protein [Candidatus Roizmanbacteria bacterium]
MAIIAQAELVGRPFNRNIHLNKGGSVVDFAHESCVRVAALFNTSTGDVSFRRLDRLPSEISSFPHLPLHGTIFDSTWHEGSSLTNVLKEGASTPFVDTNAAFMARGGDLESLLKQDGFTLSTTRIEIARERERQKREVVYGPHVAALFQGAQKHAEKTGGVGSSHEALKIIKERNRKKFHARQATIEKKNRTVEFP